MASQSMHKLFRVGVCQPLRAAHLEQEQWAIWWCKTALVCGPLRSNWWLSIRSSHSSSALMWLENGHLSRQKASNGALKCTLYSPAGHQAANFSWCWCITSLHQSALCYCCCWDITNKPEHCSGNKTVAPVVTVIIKTDLGLFSLCIKSFSLKIK